MSGIDRTATMISSNSPAPNVVTASTDSGAGTEGWRAFDKTGAEWVASTTTGTLEYDFGSALYASDEYRITPQSTARAPQDWKYQGWDGGSWIDLDTRSGVNTGWSSNVSRPFTCVNVVKYSKYRVDVTAINGGSNLEIEEMNIYAPSDSAGFLSLF